MRPGRAQRVRLGTEGGVAHDAAPGRPGCGRRVGRLVGERGDHPQIGVNCVLLKYRVPDSGPYPRSAAALEDAQRAVGLVRLHAAEWGIDPDRVGVLGFSAGAHLAAALSNHYDKRLYPPQDAADQLSYRPDFAVVLYPGYLAMSDRNFAANPDIQPTANTPPTFILQAEDDYTAHVENAVVYFMQLKNVKVPAELHIYSEGGHGFGLGRGISRSSTGLSSSKPGCTPSKCCRRNKTSPLTSHDRGWPTSRF